MRQQPPSPRAGRGQQPLAATQSSASLARRDSGRVILYLPSASFAAFSSSARSRPATPSLMLSSPHLLHVHLPDPARFLMPRDVHHPPRLQPALTRDPYSSIAPPHASLSQSTLPPPLPPVLNAQPPPLPDTQLSNPKSARRHVCSTCERAFSTSGHLARHTRVHTGERNHKCPFPGCETRCSRQDNLQQQ